MYIVFDVGATKIRVATSKDLEKIENVEVIDSIHSGSINSIEEVANKIETIAVELANNEPIEVIAGGVTAVIDNTKGQKIAGILSQRLKIPAYADNDAAVVGLGEACFGAGKDFSIVQYMTVSTGVGGARIVDGIIDRSTQGFEPGHQVIKFDEKDRESLEDLASGKAISKKFGKEPKEINDEKVWDDLAYILAIGVYNTMLHWSPEVVVLGGPMIIGNPSISIEKVREHVKNLVHVLPKAPLIKESQLEDYGGLYGALSLIKQAKK